jgi:trans-aconitate 2-methyltransferase
MDQDSVKDFYDQFLESRMLSYRLYGNRRFDRALARLHPLLRQGQSVLDIGCGIGIFAERVARIVAPGKVWGTDISEENIWYARQTVERRNVSFFAGNAVTGFEAIAGEVEGPVDVVTLIDVIEHIPAEHRPRLLADIRAVLGPGGILFLTYPSPQYQRFLREEDPGELQIIDEIIEPEVILAEALGAGFYLRHYSLESVWRTDQYVHCLFETASETHPIGESPSATRSLLSLVRKVIGRGIVLPIRRRKYVDRVFRNRSRDRQ